MRRLLLNAIWRPDTRPRRASTMSTDGGMQDEQDNDGELTIGQLLIIFLILAGAVAAMLLAAAYLG